MPGAKMKVMSNRRVYSLLILAACLAPFAASADTGSTRMPVSVRVLPVATLIATPLRFGQFTRDSKIAYGQATITVSLSPCVPYNITLDAGMHYSAGWRNVERSGFLIRYRLFQESGREWGDRDFENTYPRGRSLAGTGIGSPQRAIVRGVLYVSSIDLNAPEGLYQDLVRVTLYY
jgi:spore coat protein U-like protein